MKQFSFNDANFDRQTLNGLDWTPSESIQFVDEEGSPMNVWFMEGSDLDSIVGQAMLDKITECANLLHIRYGHGHMQVLVWLALRYRESQGNDFVRLVHTEIS